MFYLKGYSIYHELLNYRIIILLILRILWHYQSNCKRFLEVTLIHSVAVVLVGESAEQLERAVAMEHADGRM